MSLAVTSRNPNPLARLTTALYNWFATVFIPKSTDRKDVDEVGGREGHVETEW